MEFLVCIQIPGKVSVNQEYKLGIFYMIWKVWSNHLRKDLKLKFIPIHVMYKPYTQTLYQVHLNTAKRAVIRIEACRFKNNRKKHKIGTRENFQEPK